MQGVSGSGRELKTMGDFVVAVCEGLGSVGGLWSVVLSCRRDLGRGGG